MQGPPNRGSVGKGFTALRCTWRSRASEADLMQRTRHRGSVGKGFTPLRCVLGVVGLAQQTVWRSRPHAEDLPAVDLLAKEWTRNVHSLDVASRDPLGRGHRSRSVSFVSKGVV